MKKERKRGCRREFASDALLVIGGIAVSVGVGMLCVAAGVITAGVLSMVLGYLIAPGGGNG